MTDKGGDSSKAVDWSDDEQALAALAPVLDGIRPAFGDEPKPAEAQAAEPAPKAEPEPAPKTEPSTVEPEQAATGILAKDGKHVIPYEVLAEERRLRKEAQAQIAEFNRLIEEAEGTGGEVSLPNLAELEGKFPEELIGPLKAVYAKVGSLEQSNRSLTEKLTAKDREVLEHQQEQEHVAYVQDLSGTPLLLKLEQMKGPLYEQAKVVSEGMLADDAHIASVTQGGKADLSAARKAHNVALEAKMRDLLGMPALPPKSEPKPVAQPKALPALEQTAAPESISDLSGGHAPAASEGEGFVNMDAGKSMAFLTKMTPKQQDEWLARSFR